MNEFKKTNLFFFLLLVAGPFLPLALGTAGILGWPAAIVLFTAVISAGVFYAVNLKCPYCGFRLARHWMQPWPCLALWSKGSECWKCHKKF